ncbi:MAG TPA: GGDEF domain-containing protein [Solirubrobacteraceae bacterium]|nr:GGDEF domain-containing protein [Solirubrobacteraceae bacterium]
MRPQHADKPVLGAALAAGAVALLCTAALAGGLAAGAGSSAAWAVAGAGLLGAAALGAAWLAPARASARRFRQARLALRQLRELLAVSESAGETHRLLIEHAQLALPGAGAAILAVGDDGAGLAPVLSQDVDQTPLASIHTVGVGRRSCLAIRLGRRHDRGPGDRELICCEICGAVAASVACDPLSSRGEVIGSVLVAHAQGIPAPVREALAWAAVLAGPVLAGQRELHRSEELALSDPLTGLPNRRAADQTLRRMVAHAGRSLSPLGVVLLDLDRFRVLNDLHGASHGDRALAAVGRLLSESIRASDFAARFGGEEFLLVLPDTDRPGCLEVAEKLRRLIERTPLVHTGPITASFGVACLPDDAVDPERLLREADRALYMAKTRGRNRVHAADRGPRGGA